MRKTSPYWVLLFALFQFFHASDLLELQVSPRSPVFEQKGAMLTLTCEVIGDDPITESLWLKDGVPMNPDAFDKNGDELELELDSLEEKDSGNYSCKVNDEIKTVAVVVYVPPHLDENLKNQRLSLWKNGSIECPVKSSLDLTVRWRRNNARVMKGETYDPVDKILFFKNVTKEQGGKYVCEASIPQTGKRYQFDIEVELQDPPRMFSWKGTAKAIEGTQTSIICAAEGLPKPTFKFYRDDSTRPIVSSATVTVNSEEGKLFWQAVALEDAGNYTCEASNRLGNESKPNRLIVLASPRITEFSNITFKAGEALRIKCKAVGYPTPRVSIVKHVGNQTLMQVVGNEGESWTVLDFEKPKEQVDVLKDAGAYDCVAENSQGRAENRSFVDILFAPIFDDRPKPEEYLLSNHSSNLTCKVLSNPLATIAWTKNGNPVDSTDKDVFRIFEELEGHVFKSTLQITPVEDESGLYVCKVGNVFGDVSAEIDVQEAVVPEKPELVTILEKYSTSMVLGVKDGWNGGNPIINYKVQYTENEPIEVFLERMQRNEDYEKYDSLLKIENLSPKTVYDFEVSGVNLVGVGSFWSIRGETDAMSYPQQVVLEKGKTPCYQPGDVVIRWKEPDSSGSPVEKYRIQYREVTDSGQKAFVAKETTALKYKLEGLSQSSKYEVRVAAKNAIGWSPDSEVTQFHVCRDTSPVHSPASQIPKEDTANAQSNAGWLLGIVFGVLVVVCILVDLACYAANGCGVTKLICTKIRGRGGQDEKYGEKAEQEEREILNMVEKQSSIVQPTEV